MSEKSVIFWDVHFCIATILSCLSILAGAATLISGLVSPVLSHSPITLGLLGVTEAWILFCMAGSIRLIGRGIRGGWPVLLGCCFLFLVVTPIAAIHLLVATRFLG